MYSRPRRIPATINQICEAANALIKVVEPNETSKTGQAADARATFEALETKAGKPDVEALDGRIANLEKNGTGGSSSVDVVTPDEKATKGQAADAKDVYEDIRGIYDNISELEVADVILEEKLLKKVNRITNPPNGVAYPNEVYLENGGFYLIGANESAGCNAYLPIDGSYEPQTFIVYCRNGTSTRFIDQLGRTVLSNLNGTSYTGGSVNLRLMGFPTQRFVAVTMRIIKGDTGNEIIHLEVV